MIAPAMKRGSGELAILTVLAEERLHGYEIAKRIEQQTSGVLRFNLASLYPLLYTMEKRGWVKGTWEIAASGRKRRCYRLTPAGRKYLAPLRQEWTRFFRALHRLAGVAHA
ncbi:MAG TPA: helix-turn-helix transcriptional regulator [Candidatus Acidoferrales bacterium]|nr:helix-turn-helix transcriptional regulator [Candidatus Acidoferrales bacterium]